MRLAIVGDVPATPSGLAEGYDIGSLATALARRGHDVRLVTASPAAHARDHEVVRIPVDPADRSTADSLMPMIGEIGRFLVDTWSEDAPDAVHCHDWAYGMAAQLAAKHRPVPIVQAFHRLTTRGHTDAGALHGTAVKLETLLARNATMVTTSCTDEMDEVIRMGCPRARVTVLPPGVDVDAYSDDGTRVSRGTARHRIVALAQDFSARSGLEQVVAVLPSLPAAELVIIASGSAPSRLLATAEQLGVRGRLHVVATTDDGEIAGWLRSADVAVCPAAFDSDPRTVLRAMACGVAVVATETAGPQDAIIADVTGLLVPAGNRPALSRALRSVLGQTVLRQGMGLAGRARVRSRYSWDRVATDAESVFDAAARRVSSMSL